jgi:carbamoyltransferase
MKNPSPKYYVGLAANYHDAAIALADEQGKIVFAEATERYLQSKRAFSTAADQYFYIEKIFRQYPFSDYELALNWTSYTGFFNFLKSAGVAYALKNYAKLTKKLAGRKGTNADELAGFFNFSYSLHFASLLMSGSSFKRAAHTHFDLPYKKHSFFDHHLCHAYHAYYTSSCREAIVLVLDRAGDEGSGYSIYEVREQSFKLLFRSGSGVNPGSFYGMLTSLCGFSPLAGEQWKVMGMAPYGKKHDQLYSDMQAWMSVDGIDLRSKNPRQFLHIREKLKKNFYQGLQREDIAFTGQLVYEETIIALVNSIHKKWPLENLVISGGCGLNSACNGKLHVSTPFKNVFIPSAPADDGTAIGAALLNFQKHNPSVRILHGQSNPFLGSTVNEEDILALKQYSGYSCKKFSYEEIYTVVAKALLEGKIVGWSQGRAEFGPRALGNRSILANPCLPDMKDKINSQVKFREEFRPFAPAILEEYAKEFFEDYFPTPYMERVLTIREEKRKIIPAVNHVDNTGRLQTVTKEFNPHFYNLIAAFHKLSGVPVLLNTSFNVMGKPIVDSVKDMAAVFTNSGISMLVIDEYVFTKDERSSK